MLKILYAGSPSPAATTLRLLLEKCSQDQNATNENGSQDQNAATGNPGLSKNSSQDQNAAAFLADTTVTMGALKLALYSDAAKDACGKIIVADEITPDTSRFWDSSTHEPLDKDRFRRDMDNVAEAYQEVLHRMIGVG